MDILEVMEKQNLAGADLSCYSLGGRDLSGKNFRGADLSFAHLGNANLRGADLRNALLRESNLGAADLTGADLRCADLRGANLNGATLVGADLRDAMGLEDQSLSMASFIKPVILEETEEYQVAKQNGYFPISHWGRHFVTEDGRTLYRVKPAWGQIKAKLGQIIFGDPQTFEEVRLVKQYKNYSQWAYMFSKKGFQRLTIALGVRASSK